MKISLSRWILGDGFRNSQRRGRGVEREHEERCKILWEMSIISFLGDMFKLSLG